MIRRDRFLIQFKDFRFINYIPQLRHVGIREKLNEHFNIGYEKLRKINMNCFSITRQLNNYIEYVGAMRISPLRTYLNTGERRIRVGSNGEHAISILALDAARSGGRTKGIIRNVSDWLNNAEIANKIKINPISDRHFEILIQHPVTKEFENYADVGYGNSQVIPLLIAGYNLNQNSVLIVEQPEIHLHPKAQSELAEFFTKIYKNGIQSIIETHSEHLIIRFQQHIANGLISPEDIIFYYVYAYEGKKRVAKLRLDSKGIFIDEWPQGFFPERLEEAKKLSKIRHSSK